MTDGQIEKAARDHADRYFFQDAEILCNEPWNNAKDLYAKTLAGFAKHCISHQWIPVDERLPEDDRLVLAHFPDVDPELCYATAYYVDGAWQTSDDWYYDCRIDFWMPIPIPPLNPEKNDL